MTDLEIYQSANALLDHHGPTAWQHALRRIAELGGDEAGQAVWLRVLEAIEDLERTVPVPGETVQ